jgi:head-tail adaptor
MLGLCNLKADFERLTRVEDGVGGYEEKWTAFKTDWPCRLQSARSRAHSYLDKTEIDADGVLYCPFFEGLTEKDRVNLQGRVLSIALVDNWNEEKAYLKIYVQETKG